MTVRRARRLRSDDPTPRHIGDSVLEQALSGLSDAERELLTDAVMVGAEEAARTRGLPAEDVRELLASLLQQLADSPQAPELLAELNDPDGPLYAPSIRAAMRRAPVHRCARSGCISPPFPQLPTGRPRIYCGDACKQAALRERQKRGIIGQLRTKESKSRYLVRNYAADPELPAPRRPSHPSWDDYLRRRLEAAARHHQQLSVPQTFRSGSLGSLGVGARSVGILTGQPGTGKTAFLDSVTAHMQSAGSRRWFWHQPRIDRLLANQTAAAESRAAQAALALLDAPPMFAAAVTAAVRRDLASSWWTFTDLRVAGRDLAGHREMCTPMKSSVIPSARTAREWSSAGQYWLPVPAPAFPARSWTYPPAHHSGPPRGLSAGRQHKPDYRGPYRSQRKPRGRRRR